MTTMKHEAATDVATFAPSNKETLPETKALLNQVVADLYVAHIALPPSTLVYAWTWLYGLASKNGRIHGQLGCNLR